jgi:hypothetical protein
MATPLTLAKLVTRAGRIGKLSLKIGVVRRYVSEWALPRRNPRENVKLVPVTVSGFSSPLYLRAGTTDMYTFLQVMVDMEYDI